MALQLFGTGRVIMTAASFVIGIYAEVKGKKAAGLQSNAWLLNSIIT